MEHKDLWFYLFEYYYLYLVFSLFNVDELNVEVNWTMFYLQEKFTPAKYFSIDRVFRNETLDATHLAEFHQIEGVVADYNLTLGDLIGVLYEFFKKLG